MAVTNADIKQALGRKYDPEAVDSLHNNHRGLAKVYQGTHQAVGKLPTQSDGQMLILKQLNLNTPKQSIISKLRGKFNDK